MEGYLGKIFAAIVSTFLIQSAGPVPVIDVTFKMTPPKHLRQIKSFFISGNHEVLGNWAPDKIHLSKVSDQLWSTQVHLPRDFVMEFKVTMGDWNHVEVDNFNQPIKNHRFHCSSSCEINIEPENFRLEPFHKKPASASGNIQYFHEIYFDELQNKRSIAIYLPPEYEKSTRTYPVIYASDGQNLFD